MSDDDSKKIDSLNASIHSLSEQIEIISAENKSLGEIVINHLKENVQFRSKTTLLESQRDRLLTQVELLKKELEKVKEAEKKPEKKSEKESA